MYKITERVELKAQKTELQEQHKKWEKVTEITRTEGYLSKVNLLLPGELETGPLRNADTRFKLHLMSIRG